MKPPIKDHIREKRSVKPRAPINTGKKVEAARLYLGLTKVGLARAMRFGPNGRQTIRRIENETHPVPGPMQVALEFMVEGHKR